MKTKLSVVLIALTGLTGLAAFATSAVAETFEEIAVDAHKLPDAGALVFPFADACKLSGDMARRACQGIRTARQAALAGKRWVTISKSGVGFGKFDVKGQVPVIARGCVLCTPAKPEGEPWYIVAKGVLTSGETGLAGPDLGQTMQRVADEATAQKFAADAQLSTELVFALTADKPVAKGGSNALTADVLAWRIVDRCTGEVLLSQPESAAAAAPSGRPEECGGTVGKPKDVPKDDGLPVQLSRWDVQRGMSAVRGAVQECHKKYQIPGNANAVVEINTDGSVKSVSLKGDFVGTPTGTCLIKVVQGAKFPAFKKGPMRVDYPFILR
jgi:hypothetical protein